MNQVKSADGTLIAYDRLGGDGVPLIVVGGATCDRSVTRDTAEALAEQMPVVNYDRRGRGDSGDTAPYSVLREVEDLAALVEAAGGQAAVYGHSSGAALVMHAAASGVPMTKIVLHEAPYGPDTEESRRATREYGEQVRGLLAAGRDGDALALFFRLTGMPAEVVEGLRGEPWWRRLEANAPTLAYDSEVMGDLVRGGTLCEELPAAIHAPTLVISGGASPDWMIATGQRIADLIPRARHEVLAGRQHVVPPEILAPVVAAFLAG